MRKIYISLLIVAFALNVMAQNRVTVDHIKNVVSQKSISNLAPDFTATDLNGTTHHLYDYLNAGKVVIIDISATWCAPCWAYHTSGILEEVYNTYGPNGTNEIMVFMVEGDATTGLDDLNGLTTGTQGDWVTGTPYPIIDDATIGDAYAITYFPTIFMICPSFDYWEAGQLAAAADFYTMSQACLSQTDPPVAYFDAPSTSYMGVNVNFTDVSMGQPTSWAWTFAQGTPSTSTSQNPTVTWSTAGTFDVTLTATNANGSSTPYVGQITIYDPAAIDNKHITFEECVGWSGDFAPYQWKTVDNDGLGTYNFPLGLTYDALYDPKGFITFNAADNGATADMPAQQGNAYGVCVAAVPGTPAHNDDWLISPQIQLGTTGSLTFWVKSHIADYGLERFVVYVSTTTDDLTSFTNQLSTGAYETAPVAWTQKTYDLAAFAGQSIYVAIQCVSADAWVFEVDDIIVSTNLSVSHPDNSFVSVYPVPSTGKLHIDNITGSSVVVYNLVGEVVASIENANEFNTIDLTDAGVGSYFVKIISSNTSTVYKVQITK